jgi:S-disulfanyl-L-cysteine oxidoreductase SoxD
MRARWFFNRRHRQLSDRGGLIRTRRLTRAPLSRLENSVGRAVLLAVACGLTSHGANADETYGLGRPATTQEISGWDIDVSPNGAGLPAGRGSVHEGEAVYAAKCAACHGGHGEGKPMDQLVGGQGTVFDAKSQRTVGSFWPYATTLFDFVRRAMPLNAPQSLSADETYALCAYLLYLNDIVPETTTLDAMSLPKIEMPNRAAFTSAYPPPATGTKR